MMRKSILLILALVACTTITSCNNDKNVTTYENEPIKVVKSDIDSEKPVTEPTDANKEESEKTTETEPSKEETPAKDDASSEKVDESESDKSDTSSEKADADDSDNNDTSADNPEVENVDKDVEPKKEGTTPPAETKDPDSTTIAKPKEETTTTPVETTEQDYETVLMNTRVELKTIQHNEESKVDVVLMVVDKDEKILWERKWTGLYMTELPPNSQYKKFEDRIYIEVQGELYSIDRLTGKDVFAPVHVGSTEIPVVDDIGNVYCTGYYGPLITKVDYDGKIVWQLEDNENAIWPGKPFLEGQYVYVPFESAGEAVYNLGQINAETGDVTNFYWIEKGALIWEKVTASSTDAGYYVESVLDNDLKTGWTEGAAGDGINEWVLFESGNPLEVSKIVIYNGYHKSFNLYQANNRIKKLEIITSNNQVFTVELADLFEPIEIVFDSPIKASSLKLKIIEVYSGSKYQDTVISGIQFY